MCAQGRWCLVVDPTVPDWAHRRVLCGMMCVSECLVKFKSCVTTCCALKTIENTVLEHLDRCSEVKIIDMSDQLSHRALKINNLGCHLMLYP